MNLWNFTDQFIRERTYLHGVTPATLSWYKFSFRAFRPALDLECASVRDIRQAIVTRIGELATEKRGNKAISLNTYLRCINAYIAWAHQERLIPERFRMERLKEERNVLATLSAAQIQTFVRWAPRETGERRLHALVCLLLDSGLRISEALSLTRDRVNLDGLLITVRGKGQKERVVPISFELRRVLFRWLLSHEYPLVFPTKNGGHLTQRNVLRHFKKVATRLGISGVRVSFHTARHTFAVNYIRNGGDVFRLQRILGHSTLEMTRRYVNLQTEDLSAVHNRLSPLANMR